MKILRPFHYSQFGRRRFFPLQRRDVKVPRYDRPLSPKERKTLKININTTSKETFVKAMERRVPGFGVYASNFKKYQECLSNAVQLGLIKAWMRNGSEITITLP
jgi:hypothetical protein